MDRPDTDVLSPQKSDTVMKTETLHEAAAIAIGVTGYVNTLTSLGWVRNRISPNQRSRRSLLRDSRVGLSTSQDGGRPLE